MIQEAIVMYKTIKVVIDSMGESLSEVTTTIVNSISKPLRNVDKGDYSAKMNANAEDSIRGDYEKVGKDLFKALNNYERRKGYEITTK